MRKKEFYNIVYQAIIYLSIILLLSSCSYNREYSHGNRIEEKNINSLKSKKYNKSYIKEKIGEPQLVDFTPEEVWYYSFYKHLSVLFFKQKLKKQTIYKISFNKQGFINSIKKYGTKNINLIAVNDLSKLLKSKKSTSLTDEIFGNTILFNSLDGV